jgi:hypothetical protein
MHASGKLNQRRFSQFTRFKAIFKHSMTLPRKNELSEAFPLRSRPQKIFLQELFVNSFYRAKSGIIDSATNLQSAFGPNDLTCSSTTCKIPLRCFSERWLSPEAELTRLLRISKTNLMIPRKLFVNSPIVRYLPGKIDSATHYPALLKNTS